MAITRRFLESPFLLWMLLSLPFVSLSIAFRSGGIFYGEMLHASGELSARLLLVALSATPLRLLFPTRGWTRWLVARRRNIGVASFSYALLHTVVYLDKQGNFAAVAQDALRFDMWTAWAALLVFLLLAITSNDQSVRLLQRNWKKLHRWVYVAAVLAFVHWIFIAFNFVPGLIHLSILVAIESIRVIKLRSTRTIRS